MLLELLMIVESVSLLAS